MTTSGVLYIVTGKPYIEAAVRSAQSVRRHSPSLKIDIFTDQHPEENGLFDRVTIIPDPHRRSKVDWISHSRFERSLFLDSDTLVVSDISGMFDLLDNFDIAVAHAHARNQEKEKHIWKHQVPDVFPELNSGVLLFNNSMEARSLLERWAKAFHESGFWKDQITFRELLWSSECRFFILPPEYNLRYKRYLSFWPEREATPKILHHSEFNEFGIDGRPRSVVSKLVRKIRGNKR